MSTLIENDEQMNNQRLLPRIVLIACGSFSPPTPMHFRMFEIARDYFTTRGTHHVVGGIVSPTHDSYKKKGLVAGTHRFAMIKLALQSSDWIKASDWELQQPEWSQTLKVLQYHQNFMNNYINSPLEYDMNGTIPGWLPSGLRERQDPVQLKLLCGADLLESFAVPGLWADEDIENIVGTHGLVVISRHGSNAEKFIFESDLLTKYQENITLITNWIPNEVSSTVIRRLLSRGQSVKYLLDDRVIDYVKMQELFDCKRKNIIGIIRQPAYSRTMNNLYLNRANTRTNPNSTVNNSSPSDEEIDNDDDDVDVAERGLLMTKRTYSIKNILNSFNLDNRQTSSLNMFCCGDNVVDVGQSRKKLLPSRHGPGQVVQVVTTEKGMEVSTELQSNVDGRDASDAKKKRRTDAVNV
ncbi:nicotinamide/nicotinic acid mononucleotide adenylyltransferase 3 isoform X1 [Eurosta solidaginis]|uniref:nicotinamide/nicotinic acid mononucleotide adenylyltransferase 3 isoform X1 n=2 Tax=Eurosta solidaginis TaxID=178769 RepID=UPI003530B1F1